MGITFTCYLTERRACQSLTPAATRLHTHMPRLARLAPLLLLLPACGDPLCDTPLYARAGSDTGTAIRTAVDTMARRWGVWPPGVGQAAALTIERAGPDTFVVTVGPACQRLDATTATVHLSPPDRVLGIEEHIGG